MANTTVEAASPSTAVRLFAGLSYLLLTTIGFLANALLAFVLVRRRAAFKHPFYALVQSLCVGDLGFLAAMYAVAAPLTLAGEPLYSDTAHLVLASFDTLFFFVILFSSFFILLNRFACFLLPALNDFLFVRNVHLAVEAPWLLAVVALVATSAVGCPKRFSWQRFHYYFGCSDELSAFGALWMTGQFYTTLALPTVMLALYLALFVYLKLQKKSSTAPAESAQAQQRAKSERALLVQGSLICLFLQALVTSFWLVPRLTPTIAGPIATNWIGIVNSSVNPFIYFSCNRLVRAQLLQAFGGAPAAVGPTHQSARTGARSNAARSHHAAA